MKTGELFEATEKFVQDGDVIPVSDELAAQLKSLPLSERVDKLRDFQDRTELEKRLTRALGSGGRSGESVADGSDLVPPAGVGKKY